jgi:DnaJ-class molecular chaperone
MTNRDLEFEAYVIMMYQELDRLDYYRLLGIERAAKGPEIKRAFYGIAAKFHPDRNRNTDKSVQKALYDIFKRVNEAYRVLCNEEQRKIYDKGLSKGTVRLEVQNRRGSGPKTPSDTIQSRPARQFYEQAAEALKKGNVMMAELHIKVALGHDRNNEAIRALLLKILQAKEKR